MRFPAVSGGLGVGMDLSWGDSHGLRVGPDGRGGLAPRVQRFLERSRGVFDYAFFSFQPRDRGLLDIARYAEAWDSVAEASGGLPLALHHTMLNLGALERRVDRGHLLDFTNALCRRYDLKWVNEDLGVWSVDGKPMPYPLPPLLTEAGLENAIRHVSEVMAGLEVPLLLEFPGFSEGTNFVVGELHAYDYFRRLAEATGVAVTLDTGHLLSYQWWLGKRGEALFDDLERLPLAACFEIHASGCEVLDGRFVDIHHGVLREEQIALTALLLERCPSARCVTYEDPKLDEAGHLRPRARPGFEQLQRVVSGWREAA